MNQRITSATQEIFTYCSKNDESTFLIQYPGSIANHEIMANAFKDAALQFDFALPSIITNIGANAFFLARLNSNFIISSSVTSIHATAFDGATIPTGYHWEQDGKTVSKVAEGGHEYKVVAD